MATVARRFALAALGLALATSGADAHYHHRHARGFHRHAGWGAAHGRLAGYHCPLGQIWRPSMSVCQTGPWRGQQARAHAAAPPATQVSHAATGAQSARHIVDTQTRVLDRRREVSPDGVTVTYVVETHVTERYPTAGSRRP